MRRLWTTARIAINTLRHFIKVLVDSGSVWNIILQDIVKQFQLRRSNKVPSGLKVIDGGQLRIHQAHILSVNISDLEGFTSSLNILFLAADIVGCNMIFGKEWLDQAKPMINWGLDTFFFRLKGGTVFELLIQTETHDQVSNTDSASTYSHALSISTHVDNSLNIAMVIKNEIFDIPDTEGVQAFVLKWRNLIEEDIMWEIY